MTALILPETAEALVFPVSFAQERLWFLDQLEGTNATYNVPTAVRLKGQVSADILQQAMAAMVERHEILRTRFQRLEGETVQVIETDITLDIDKIDLHHLSDAERETQLQVEITHEAQQPFDLSKAPLIRATLIQLGVDDYVLLITLHHIICDAWSMGIVIHELTSLYQAFIQGQSSPLGELEIQYADFAQWQREWLQGEALEKQLTYWQQTLAGAPPLLELPTDYPRPPVQTFRGRRQYFKLPLDLTLQLKQLSQDTGTTLFMVLFTAYNILLHRYSGQDDILVGSPIANRNQTEIEPLIGFFVNTLVLRTQFKTSFTFRELLQQVSQNALEAYAHQDVPFEKVVEALQPQRNLSHSPLFQVWFVLQNAPTTALDLPGFTLTPLRAETTVAKFDMALSLSETATGLAGHWEYNTDLFETDTIWRMIGHFQALLTAIVAEPEAKLEHLHILTADEQAQFKTWNNTVAPYPNQPIHQLFEAQVEQTPDAIALTFGKEQLSYQALNARANQLAHHLQDLGIGPDVLVGVCVERSPMMVVALLAILKAGGAYVPLDPTYPEERLAYMLDDAAVPILLTQETLEDRLPMSYALMVELDSEWGDISSHATDNLDIALQPENLAYVIYTSGSTGQPKGVLVQHQGIGNLTRAQQDLFQVDHESRVLQFASFSFDASVSEIFMALTCGAQLVLASRDALMPGPDLQNTLNHHHITHVTLPPSALAILSPDNLPHLNQVIVAGEACPAALARTWSQTRRFINAYGPSEATVCATAKILDVGNRSSLPTTCPIGQPIANTQIYILNQQLQPVPIGVPGEIYISSIGLAQGYLNQPELTAKRFVSGHTLDLEKAPERLYKTGDLGRYLANGDIEFLGRVDHQVKMRGFRIELGEVESALTQQFQVQDAVVLLRDDHPGNSSLVAYVVLTPGSELTTTDLRLKLKQKIPDYMVPGVFVLLDKLPLLPNGKVDRHALPAPQQDVTNDHQFVSPNTPIEQGVAAIFADILNIERVGLNHNFFEIGGHSLLATQVISQLRQEYDLELPLGTLFEAPTVEELSNAVEAALSTDSQAAVPAIVPVAHDNTIPLSWAQERLWFLDQLEGASATYNISTAVGLQGQLQVNYLAQAMKTIGQRHQILHTRFDTIDGVPVQVIEPDTAFDLHQVDLRHIAVEDVDREIQQWMRQDAKTPFDLSQSPLIRATLLQLPDQDRWGENGPSNGTGVGDYVLLVTMHHIVSDGWSMRIMIRELSAIYQALIENQPIPLPPLAIQYADVAQWQRQWLQGEVIARQLAYWQEYLAEAPMLLELPTDRPRPAVQTFQGQQHTIALSSTLTEQLRALCQETDCTLFMVLLAAFMVLLHRYSGQDDILVGSPIANRNRAEIEPLIGFFVNTLVLRGQFNANTPFIEVLQQVRQDALACYEHQDLPFEQLVEALQPQRHLSYSPLFQVMFSLQNAPSQQLTLPGVSLTPLQTNSIAAKFDLTLSLVDKPERVSGIWEYNTDLFNPDTIERMGGHFEVLLQGIVANPHTAIAQLPLLTTTEQQRFQQWNDTAFTDAKQSSIYQDFEAQVRRTPGAIAIICGQQQLTYADLNQRANQLAHHLQTLGVGPKTLVGICVERSIEMMVALFGVLKSGAAYVPLDPKHPIERLNFILADAQITALVTQAQFQSQFATDETVKNAAVIDIDTNWEQISQHPDNNLDITVNGDDLAYLIYTSGSTGQPKGVMVEHRQVANFFTGMDQRLGSDSPGTWLAITTIAFDISVLELFWTLGRGFKVVLQLEQDLGITSQVAPSSPSTTPTQQPGAATVPSQKQLDFSLFYFGSETGNQTDSQPTGSQTQLETDRYHLLMEGSKFADQHGFSAVWVPERHFHEFGGIYPNPAVAAAAIAAVTQTIHIRAGSVVLPLHSPIRVAEEWSFVDNLSHGRIGISIASGWQSDDFVLAPGDYGQRKQIMVERLQTIRQLWRGDSITLENGHGKPIQVKTFPQPIQPELPTWMTAAGNPETFRLAGELGCHLLTHLLGQNTDELAQKIAIYRQAWQDHGHPGSGHVTLMLHTFIGDDLEQVRETVRTPLTNYLGQSASLIEKMIQNSEYEAQLDDFSPDDRTVLINQAFERYFQTSGLLGTPKTCLTMLAKLQEINVDEIGCLIDFGVNPDTVLASLPKLKQLMDLSRHVLPVNPSNSDLPITIPEQIHHHQVTHLQCTPSQAHLLTLLPDGIKSLQTLETLMLGGEALPSTLAHQLRQTLPGKIHNMYGPTEATIWASTQEITTLDQTITLGNPIANTQFYILDQQQQLVPVGVPGELYIGGAGVARGYWQRPHLTAERFLDGSTLSPLAHQPPVPLNRLYKTGDQGRYLSDGTIEFLGRIDHQVKLQGFRIELGEIETVLGEHPQLQQAVVIVDHPDNKDPRLVAYGVPTPNTPLPTAAALMTWLRKKLPDYMVPKVFVPLTSLPLTPNGKINRRALPDPIQGQFANSSILPRNATEQQLSEIWCDLLNLNAVGVQDNFFELGGRSLLAVQLASRIKTTFGQPMPLATLFQAPTIEGLANYLDTLVLPAAAITPPLPLSQAPFAHNHQLPSCMVPLQPQGNRPPYFLIPGSGGTALQFHPLAQSISKDQPLYGLQALELTIDGIKLDRVETMASYYLQAIQKIQPQGPYYLGGHSLGGKVAFEIARQLLQQNQKVHQVTIFDTTAPLATVDIDLDQWDDTRWLVAISEAATSSLNSTSSLTAEQLHPLTWSEQLKVLQQQLIQTGMLSPEDSLTQLEKLVQLAKVHHRSAISYHCAEKLPIPLIVFKASHGSAITVNNSLLQHPTLGWQQVSTRPVICHTIPGNHYTLLSQPNVQQIAQKLEQYL